MSALEEQQTKLIHLFRERGIGLGETIPSEPQLAAMLGMGRQAVREALCALQALGVIEGRQGARRRLRGFDPAVFGRHIGMTLPYTQESFQELLDLRKILETQYFPPAMRTLTSRKIRNLRAVTDSMRQLAAEGKTFLDEDERFHALLYEGLDNRTLAGVLSGFWQFFKTASTNITTGRDLPRTAAVHAAIVDAIEAGDDELAAHRLNIHFFDVRDRLSSLHDGDFSQGGSVLVG